MATFSNFRACNLVISYKNPHFDYHQEAEEKVGRQMDVTKGQYKQ